MDGGETDLYADTSFHWEGQRQVEEGVEPDTLVAAHLTGHL